MPLMSADRTRDKRERETHMRTDKKTDKTPKP
jgi:hypothetical protein